MTLKQEYFAIQYIKSGCDLDAAANESNITTQRAKRWLAAKNVREYIDDLNKDIEKSLKINKTKIVKAYLDIHESAVEGDPVFSKDGIKLYQKPDRSAAKASLDSVSKLMGYDAPIKIDMNVDLSTWLTQLPNNEEIIDVETN